jgi:hypothetical protein
MQDGMEGRNMRCAIPPVRFLGEHLSQLAAAKCLDDVYRYGGDGLLQLFSRGGRQEEMVSICIIVA